MKKKLEECFKRAKIKILNHNYKALYFEYLRIKKIKNENQLRIAVENFEEMVIKVNRGEKIC
jgi:hypothetical protein